MPGLLRRTRAYLEFTLRPPGSFVDFLNFASDFAPDQLSDSVLEERHGEVAVGSREGGVDVGAPSSPTDSGKTASFQNGAPNTLCFPWKFPATQSAGDPLFSFLFSGKPRTGQQTLGSL